VVVFDGANQGKILQNYFAYATNFTSGIYVAAGDVNGDGLADVVTGSGPGGAPMVRAFDGKTMAMLQSFTPYGQFFNGSARVAAADVNGDGFADLLTGPGSSGGPNVVAFNGQTLAALDNFLAYDPHFLGGVFVGGY
jgi:hypothetical protein